MNYLIMLCIFMLCNVGLYAILVLTLKLKGYKIQ